MSWFESVKLAFPDPRLCERIYDAAALDPGRLPALFQDIAGVVHSLHIDSNQSRDSMALMKKRKLYEMDEHDKGPSKPIPTGGFQINGTLYSDDAHLIQHYTTDVSVQVPARKKMKLQICLEEGNLKRAEVRLLNPTSQLTEFMLHTSQIVAAFCLPVPDKQQRQANIVLLASSAAATPGEQFVLTVSDAPTGDDGILDSVATLARRALQGVLSPHNLEVIEPSEHDFASSIPQPHRKGEPAYHVAAHRGSKDGYLFFLSTGILFGFRKPLAFFPHTSIESISYTSVLQRTFNLVISVSGDPLNPVPSDDEAAREVIETEFSMLDQANFAGIDAYVRRHELQDASMAAARRAKLYNVNRERKAGKDDNTANSEPANGEEEQSELQRAEQELQDAEDEEEEDYEASGGESDGEGDYSEEEEEYAEGEGYEEGYEEVEGEGEEGYDEETEHAQG